MCGDKIDTNWWSWWSIGNKNLCIHAGESVLEQNVWYLRLPQALKHLHNIQVINFGDCLVRPEGATAIAESVTVGLPILKVNENDRLSSGLSFHHLSE